MHCTLSLSLGRTDWPVVVEGMVSQKHLVFDSTLSESQRSMVTRSLARVLPHLNYTTWSDIPIFITPANVRDDPERESSSFIMVPISATSVEEWRRCLNSQVESLSSFVVVTMMAYVCACLCVCVCLCLCPSARRFAQHCRSLDLFIRAMRVYLSIVLVY